jgi:SAM-dependent methyltransferase
MKPFDGKVHMDGLRLALRPSSFDVVLSVAVIHHMATHQQRLAMVQQLQRVVADGGWAVISVLGYEQKAEVYLKQDVLLEYCLPHHKLRERPKETRNEKEGQQKEEQQKEGQQKEEQWKEEQWKGGKKQRRGRIYQRYYHLFKAAELRELIEAAGLQIISEETDEENIIVLSTKVSSNEKHLPTN